MNGIRNEIERRAIVSPTPNRPGRHPAVNDAPIGEIAGAPDVFAPEGCERLSAFPEKRAPGRQAI